MTLSCAPTLQMDCYKEFHPQAMNKDIAYMYENYTNRSNRLSNVKDNEKVAFVGLQAFIVEYLQTEWNEVFFKLPKHDACATHQAVMTAMTGSGDVSRFEALHDLGYLPLRIKALPEGSLVNYQVAPITFINTHPDFAWLPGMLETVFSSENWGVSTSATTAVAYMKTARKYFKLTGAPMEMIPYMCHDFSFRGIATRAAAAASGFGHLASGFMGTDTIPSVLYAIGGGYSTGVDGIGVSVNATEHSVTCSGIAAIVETIKDGGLYLGDSYAKVAEEMGGDVDVLLVAEALYYKNLMLNVAPTGILSIVADSYDFWSVVTKVLPWLKPIIMNRDGKVVIRPDSGDPVDILCGDVKSEVGCVRDGLIECLYNIFGGTQTDKGYILLDEHIGAIYGDSITLERQEEIYKRLYSEGFAPMVVLGIGSFSYQYVTRDTHGSAMKATNITMRDGTEVPICKEPKTDPGKKSAKGYLRVEREGTDFVMYDQQTKEQEQEGLLETVFLDGELVMRTSLESIRTRIASQLEEEENV